MILRRHPADRHLRAAALAQGDDRVARVVDGGGGAQHHAVVHGMRDARHGRHPRVLHSLPRGPAAQVGASTGRRKHAQPDEVAGPQAGPAVQPAPPRRRHRRSAPVSAEQPAGDGGDRVRVAADTHRGVQRVLQVLAGVAAGVGVVGRDRRGGDRVPGGLQRGDGETVVAQVRCGAGLLRVVDPGRPPGAPAGREQAEAGADVEATLGHGDADRLAPQHARVPGERVRVGELGDGAGGLRRRLPVLQVAETDDGGTHQRPVARRPARAPVVVPGRPDEAIGCRPDCRTGRPACSGGCVAVSTARAAGCTVGRTIRGSQDAAGEDADVRGAFAAPVEESVGDAVEGGALARVAAVGDHVGDAERHLGVVAPLARLVRAEPAAGHLGLADGRGGELVGNTERVTGRLGQEHACGAVEGCWVHAVSVRRACTVRQSSRSGAGGGQRVCRCGRCERPHRQSGWGRRAADHGPQGLSKSRLGRSVLLGGLTYRRSTYGPGLPREH